MKIKSAKWQKDRKLMKEPPYTKDEVIRNLKIMSDYEDITWIHFVAADIIKRGIK